MTCGVYKIEAPSGKFYVGSSCRVEERLGWHRRMVARGQHPNARLQAAFDKHGPLKESLLLVCRRQDLFLYEQRCITGMKPKYNISPFADRPEFTEERRQKMSALMKGRVFTPEHRARISTAKMGHSVSSEARAKIGAAGIGRECSEETRKKLSESHIGLVRSEEHRKNLSLANRGKTRGLGHRHSDESKAKMSASRRRRHLLNDNSSATLKEGNSHD